MFLQMVSPCGIILTNILPQAGRGINRNTGTAIGRVRVYLGMMDLTRRGFLLTGAALLPRGGIGAAVPADLITLSPGPKDLEMPVEDFIDQITPVEHFFVRCHTMIPQVNPGDWKLEIAGLVERPLSLSLADLRKLPRAEMISVLECAGNGRRFYQPPVAGAQWRFGSVGNARWTGVRLQDVLEKSGVKAAATQLLLDGADA